MTRCARQILAVMFLAFSAAVPAAADPHYFGYYGSHYIGSASEPAVNLCTDARFNGHTNVAMIDGTTISGLAATVDALAQCGKKSIINVRSLFFEDVSPGYGKRHAAPESEWHGPEPFQRAGVAGRKYRRTPHSR
jgi:hypothetical protein